MVTFAIAMCSYYPVRPCTYPELPLHSQLSSVESSESTEEPLFVDVKEKKRRRKRTEEESTVLMVEDQRYPMCCLMSLDPVTFSLAEAV